jgi:hypothetical protein
MSGFSYGAPRPLSAQTYRVILAQIWLKGSAKNFFSLALKLVHWSGQVAES